MTTMRTHYKYALELTGQDQTVEMPEGAAVVHVAVQDGRPCIWAMVDPEAEPVERVFTLLAAGQQFDAAHWMRWGTVLLSDGALVFQVAERRPAPAESKARKGRCPFCNEAGTPSRVRAGNTSYEEQLDRPEPYYDELGSWHNHGAPIAVTRYDCSAGHRWTERNQSECRAGECPFNGIDETTRLADDPKAQRMATADPDTG